MIKFLHPEYLLIILFTPFASLFYLMRVQRLKNLILPEKIAKRYFDRIKYRTFFFSLAFCFLCISLAGPLYGKRLVSVQKKGASLMFVMDISSSMMVEEKNVSRLARAKYIADFIIEKYPNIAFGLTLAKGEGILSIPLTFDANVVKEQISILSPHIMSSVGTNLESGISTSLSSFPRDRSDAHIVLLFTDGEETKGELKRVVSEVIKNDVLLIIVGLGTKEGGVIEVLNEKCEKVKKLSVQNSEKLQEVARLCEGLYINGENFASLAKIFEVLEAHTVQKEKVAFKQEDKVRRSETAFMALLLFCLGVMVGMLRIAR